MRQFRGRPHAGEEPETPKWMAALDTFTPAKAAGAGALLSGLNPKNLLLAVAAAVAIAQTGIGGGEQAGAYAVFVVVATLGVGTPVALSIALGERARERLDRLERWMSQHNAAIMSVVLLILGVKLIGDAVSGFSA